MRLKAQNYCITISYKFKHNPVGNDIKTCFIIKAADVDEEKALKIANILFPDFVDIKVKSIENDELTLTFEDYQILHTMVNDKLRESIKASKTPYKEIKTPYDLMYKKLLEKMSDRIHQFTRGFC